jgi:plasmid stability protein
MYSITVKNIPPDVYERLKESAKANRRSINSEIITIIEGAVASKRISPETYLARARQLRERTADYLIEDDKFTEAKRAGRS